MNYYFYIIFLLTNYKKIILSKKCNIILELWLIIFKSIYKWINFITKIWWLLVEIKKKSKWTNSNISYHPKLLSTVTNSNISYDKSNVNLAIIKSHKIIKTYYTFVYYNFNIYILMMYLISK